MDDLQIFDYQETPVRVITIENEPWWILADVCRVLELSNPSVVAGRLDDDEKQRLEFDPKSDLGLGHNGAIIINEPGLYSVILRSDKPGAKAFKRWITHEVIPAIRKLGRYTLNISEKEPLTNAQRLEIMRIISNCNRYTLPEVLKYCDPDWVLCDSPESHKEIVLSVEVPSKSEIGETLKGLLSRYDMSQAALSERSGCSKGAISQYCHGINRPSEKQWKKIMDVFAEAEESA